MNQQLLDTLQRLVTTQPPEPADAIIWLQGNEFDRGEKVMELFQKKLAPKIMVVGNNDRVVDVGTVKVRDLLWWLGERGVLVQDVLADDRCMNTHEQAERVIQEAVRRSWKKILLVGSTHHQLRAFLTVLHEAQVQGWQGRIVNQPVLINWDTRPSGRTKTTSEAFVEEVEKLSRYKDHVASVEEGYHYLTHNASPMIVAVLQARFSSTRLPGKVLKKILNLPMLEHQIRRVLRSRKIDKLIVATSENVDDDPIAMHCAQMGVDCFRGSLEDVLDRFYQSVKGLRPQSVVRLTGDCPLADPQVIDETIQFFLDGSYDYVSNCQEPFTFPDGLDVEVMTFTALETAWKEAELPSEREHVTPFIKRRPERFCLGHYTRVPSLGHLRWTVDELQDFELITKIYESLYPGNPAFSTEDILQLLEQHPEWKTMNKAFERNAGSKKSKEQDKAFLEQKTLTSKRCIKTCGGRRIGEGEPAYIISEIGINHNGDLETALWMIDESARAGADAVKVQIIFADQSYAKESESYKIFKAIEFSLDEWKQIADHAHKRGIDIFATFVQPDDMHLADELGFSLLKVSSSNVTNFPLLKAVAAAHKPVIMSTGLSYLSEVDEAVRYLEDHGCHEMALLHCTSLYPTPAEEVNLRAMVTLRDVFPYPVGFSEHTLGNHCSVAAIALGASVIEKHFTLDRNMEGPDHHFSMTPPELRELVYSIREVEAAIGDGKKAPRASELPERAKLQRVIVAARDIAVGESFSLQNLTAKRSVKQGLPTKFQEQILGRSARRALVTDEPITFDVIS